MQCKDGEVIDLLYGSYDYGIKKICGRCTDGSLLGCAGDVTAYNNFVIEGAKNNISQKVFYYTKDPQELKSLPDRLDNYVVRLGDINKVITNNDLTIDDDAKKGTLVDKSFNCYEGQYINGYNGFIKNKTEHLSNVIFSCGDYKLTVEDNPPDIFLDNKAYVIIIVVILAFILRYLYEGWKAKKYKESLEDNDE